jgi:cytoskeleton protein RodZ
MSAVMAEQEKNEGIQLAVPGLGERLRNARLAQDMDVSKLASRIHLTVDVVKSLESDDFSDMPARVFVRGYVRNYARVVGLPPDSVLAQFDRQWPDEVVPVTVSPSPRLAADPDPRKKWPGMVSWLLLLLMLGLFLVWWQGYLDRFIDKWQQKGESGAGSAAPTLQVTPPEPAPQLAPETSTPAVDAPVVGSGPLSLPPAPESPAGDASGGPAPGRAVDSDATGPAVETAPETGTATSGQALAIPQPSDTATPEAAVEATPAPEPAPPAGIVVSFSDDCWVDIRDRTRTFKLVGTMKRGSRHKLGGEPPYKVILGNAHAASIQVNGQPFDLGPYTDGNVARLTLRP